jgi:hypothetical protein
MVTQQSTNQAHVLLSLFLLMESSDKYSHVYVKTLSLLHVFSLHLVQSFHTVLWEYETGRCVLEWGEPCCPLDRRFWYKRIGGLVCWEGSSCVRNGSLVSRKGDCVMEA